MCECVLIVNIYEWRFLLLALSLCVHVVFVYTDTSAIYITFLRLTLLVYGRSCVCVYIF